MSQPLAIIDAIKECHQVFQDASGIPSLVHREWVENRLAEFNLWCAGVNASGSGKSSLQARLATSLEAQIFLIHLLKLLTALLKKCIELAISDRELLRTMDTRLSQTMHDVQDTLSQLARVTVAIRDAGAKSRMQKADASFDYSNPRIQALRRHLEILILAKPSEIGTLQARVSRQGVILYSSAHRSVEVGSESLGEITKRLIEGNLRRLNRFLYAQRHAEKLSNTIQARNSLSQVTTQTTMTSSSPVLSIPTEQELKKHLLNVESATTATVIQDTIIMPVQPAHHPAATVISATASRVEYPKPPSVNIGQDVFQCPCCCQILPISVSDGAQWKKHIARDVLPYTCILNDCPCPEKLYETMETWKSHMFADHGGIPHWTCFACTSSEQHPNFDNKDDFIAHLNVQHGRGIKHQQIPILLSAWLRTSPVLIRSCPLCSYFHEDADAVLSHTAQHIHSFSLMSLPWASTKGEDPDVHGDYFQHHRYFSMNESTYGSMQASSTAGSQELDSDLPSIDFEPSTEPNELTKEKLGLLSQNPSLGTNPANWLDSLLDESEDPDLSTAFTLDTSTLVQENPGNWLDSIRDESEGSNSSALILENAASPIWDLSENRYPSNRTSNRRRAETSISRLGLDLINNTRKVRNIGACLRCSALRTKCSFDSVCTTCRNPKGGRWSRCPRSFTEMANYLTPDLLAKRLESWALSGLYENSRSTGNPVFPLPLNFGFGEDFYCLQGTLDVGTIATKDFTHAIEGDSDSLPVYPYKTDTDLFQRLLWQWLKQTWSRSSSIQQWLHICFPGVRSNWIRDVLEASWQYSVEYLYHDANSNPMNELLANAWFMAFLSTMLLLPIQMSLESRQRLFDQLQSLGYKNPDIVLSHSISRMTNRISKGLLFSFYQHLIARVMSRLQNWHTQSVRDYEPGHINCTLILIMVVFCQMEAALLDDYRDANHSNLDSSFEDYASDITTMDSVLETIMVYMRHRCKESMKRPRDADEATDNLKGFGQYRAFAQKIEEIKRNYKEEIASHQNVKLETLLKPSTSAFQTQNMERVFASYFGYSWFEGLEELGL